MSKENDVDRTILLDMRRLSSEAQLVRTGKGSVDEMRYRV